MLKLVEIVGQYNIMYGMYLRNTNSKCIIRDTQTQVTNLYHHRN